MSGRPNGIQDYVGIHKPEQKFCSGFGGGFRAAGLEDRYGTSATE
jgi:hypothetical protein